MNELAKGLEELSEVIRSAHVDFEELKENLEYLKRKLHVNRKPHPKNRNKSFKFYK